MGSGVGFWIIYGFGSLIFDDFEVLRGLLYFNLSFINGNDVVYVFIQIGEDIVWYNLD